MAGDYKQLDGEESKSSSITKRFIREIASESWPYCLSKIFVSGSNFAIMAIMASNSQEFLAASPLITSGLFITTSTMISVLYAVGIYVGGERRANALHSTGAWLHAGLISAALLSIVTILLCQFSQSIYVGVGQKASLSGVAQSYFRAYNFGATAFLAVNAWQQFLVGLGRTKLVFLSAFINTMVFALFGQWFVKGGAGLQPMGSSGLGYAFAVASWMNLLFLAVYSKIHPQFKQYNIYARSACADIGNKIKKVFALGVPIGLQIFGELFVFMMVTIYAGWLGEKELVAEQLTDQYVSFFMAVSLSLAQNVGALVSRESRSEQPKNAITMGNIGLRLSLGLSVVSAILLATTGRPVATAIANKGANLNEILDLATIAYYINAVAQIADFQRNVAGGALRGYFITWTPMFLNLISLCGVGLGLGYLLGFKTQLGLSGVYIGRGVGMLCGSIANLSLWRAAVKGKSIKVEVVPSVTAVSVP